MATAGHNPLYSDRLRSAADWHISRVYNDPQFKEAVVYIKERERRPSCSKETSKRLRQRLADHWLIDVEDVNLAMLPLYTENRKRKTRLHYDSRTNRWSISFDETTTKPELLEEWEQFQRQQALFGRKPVSTKPKPPENTALLYAIFKARQRGETFTQIYEQYFAGELPGYTGSNKRFRGGESLEAYYHKYYPGGKPIR